MGGGIKEAGYQGGSPSEHCHCGIHVPPDSDEIRVVGHSADGGEGILVNTSSNRTDEHVDFEVAEDEDCFEEMEEEEGESESSDGVMMIEGEAESSEEDEGIEGGDHLLQLPTLRLLAQLLRRRAT